MEFEVVVPSNDRGDPGVVELITAWPIYIGYTSVPNLYLSLSSHFVLKKSASSLFHSYNRIKTYKVPLCRGKERDDQ